MRASSKPSAPSFEVVSRRRFLAGLGGLAASSLLQTSCSKVSQIEKNNPRRIDVHQHIWPPKYVAIAKQNNITIVPSNGWTVEKALDDMGQAGISSALTSVTAPGLWVGNKDASRAAARESNEYAAQLVRDHPGRFGMFAAVPLPDVDGSLLEIGYAFDTLQADGICLFTVYGDKASGIEDRFLGHSMFTPILEELNRRKAVVYTHPKEADCCRNLVPEIPPTMIEYGTNTTRTIASLIFSGATSRFPDIQWIFSHAGGTTPFLIDRFLTGTAEEVVPGIVTKGAGGTGVVGSNRPVNVPNGVLHELRRLYYDTAQSANPISMKALRTLVPVSQIVFGTDFPFRTAVETGKGLTTCGVFNAQELEAIDRGNALRLLPRFNGS
jgi:predicted TIM-barrel fold metal-dependent hydrolase